MTIADKKQIKITCLLVLSSLVAAHFLFWVLPRVFETWNAQTLDGLFVLRSISERFRPAYHHQVVHVDFNKTSTERLNRPYLSRADFARLVRHLASMGVSAQVFDFVFAAPMNDADDLALIHAAREAGNTYFGIALELAETDPGMKEKTPPANGPNFVTPIKWDVTLEGSPEALFHGVNAFTTFSELAVASRGLGSVSVKFDRDGVLRRIPLLVRYQDGFCPSLAFRAVCDYLQVPPEHILLAPGKHILLKNAVEPGTKARRDILIPIDRRGNMIVNYLGPWEAMDHYSFADVLEASRDRRALEMWKEELRGKIVLVSDVTTGSADVGPVPTDANFPLAGVHANVINSILTASFLRELSNGEMLPIEILLLGTILGLSVRFSTIYFSISTLCVALVYVGNVVLWFLYAGLMLNIIRPLLMTGLAMVCIVIQSYVREEKEKAESLRQRDFVRATFGRYLSNEVVDELLDSRKGLNMGGELREVTFLVSDLRGFTALSSRLTPDQVIPILNRYFEAMVEIIGKYRGTVDEFQGDGMLVFFGAPLHASDDPERAVACAIEMQNKMIEVNARERQADLPELHMGIGINTGEVIVGNIGSEKRSKYGAVGTAINLAFRVQACTVGGQILISENTYSEVKSRVEVRLNMEVRLKGIDGTVTLYDISGIQGSYHLSLESPPID